MNKYRVGKFRITNNLIKDDWTKLLPLFANLVVVGAQPNFLGWIEYTAFSPLFDEVKEGVCAPEYTIECTENKDHTLSFSAIRND